jgi:hypothetical protein
VQPRSLKLRLSELLAAKHPHTKFTSIAESLGISDTTLRKYLRNEALSLERRVIEKACDLLEVDIAELFELVPCDFFPVGKQPLKLIRHGRNTGLDDFGTISQLHQFFGKNGILTEEEMCGSPAEIVECIRTHDCLIVGSPRTNAAGELALCSLFQADPNAATRENRRKLPLLMQAPQEWHAPSALIRTLTKSGQLPLQCALEVADSSEKFAEKTTRATADYFAPETFAANKIDHGKDFGVLFIASRQSSVRPPVRTYWVSGFTSVGTQASTMVLESDFRSFNMDTGGFVLAIIQATFRKPPNSQERRLEDFKIVHTIRGSLPATDLILNDPPAEEFEVTSLAGTDAGTVDVDPIHNSRRQRFRVVVRKTWRSDIASETPELTAFYDRELRQLPEEAFEGMLAGLEAHYATIPPERRPLSLKRYLQSVIEARDGGPGDLFRGQ